MTKKEQGMVLTYERSTARTLQEVYGKPSYLKQQAYLNCRADMARCNGYDFRITGANSNFFSCGFQYQDDNGTEHLIYHTYANRYDIELV